MAVPVAVSGRGLLNLGLLNDKRLGREQHARDGRGVGERRLRDLDRVDDTCSDEVLVDARGGVEPLSHGKFGDLAHDDVSRLARVLGDPAHRLDSGLGHDGHAGRLVAGLAEVALKGLAGVHQRGATTGDDALVDRGASR